MDDAGAGNALLMKRVLFYLGHPAHFHLFKNIISILEERGHETLVVIKTKEVLEELVKDSGHNYINLYPKQRSSSRLGIMAALIQKNYNLYKIAKRFGPNVMVGTSIEIAQVGRLMGIPSLVVNEDDAEVVPYFAWMGYPFAERIIAPHCCSVGRWEHKRDGYEGYHELAYLAPEYFAPDKEVLCELNLEPYEYSIIRFSRLDAYHDQGVRGISRGLANKLVETLRPYTRVVICSEREVWPELREYTAKFKADKLHSILSFAKLYIGDSQTMAAEAAVLGTPSVRYNDFVGRIGYLNELEHKYNLTHGIGMGNEGDLISLVEDIAMDDHVVEKWKTRKDAMLADKTDLNEFLIRAIERQIN